MADESDRIEQAMREHLGAGAELSPVRRRRLIARITGASAGPAKARPAVRWAWLGGLAAAAAAVLLTVVLWPEREPEPIAPTDILGDLLGPLAAGAPPEEASPSPKAEAEASLGGALALFLGDFEGPLAIGRAALDAPKAVAVAAEPGADEPDDEGRRLR